MDETPLVFFDGTCGLCNRFVRWVLARDRRGALRFAPIGGDEWRRRMGADAEDPGTIVLVRGGRRFERSAATVRILFEMGGLWPAAGAIFWLLPRPIRDRVYRFVAARRHRWFGTQACAVPAPSLRGRFLA